MLLTRFKAGHQGLRFTHISEENVILKVKEILQSHFTTDIAYLDLPLLRVLDNCYK